MNHYNGSEYWCKNCGKALEEYTSENWQLCDKCKNELLTYEECEDIIDNKCAFEFYCSFIFGMPEEDIYEHEIETLTSICKNWFEGTDSQYKEARFQEFINNDINTFIDDYVEYNRNILPYYSGVE